MNEITNKNIESLIYEVRGRQVMLDSDLAKLYQCTNGTKEINQAVNRNINKFPERFSWQLTKDEYENLKSQFVTSSWNYYGGRRKLPRVFTEQGVAMLATILKSKVAAQVSIEIMDAFVAMRRYLNSNLIEQKYINNMVIKDNERINLLEDSFTKLEAKEKINHIFFEGQIYDAYSLLIDILNKANNNIIIIDNYIDKKLLDILKETKIEVLLITKYINQTAIEKYQTEYQNITIKIDKTFHDRFIIIDNKTLYHCGASFKDLGTKCFAINKIEDKEYLEKIINYIWPKNC